MKIRLPKALLPLVAVAASSTAQAGYITPTVIKKDGGEMVLGTNPNNVSGYTIDVKDGENGATITKDTESTSGLFVREGQLTIGGTKEHVTVSINPNNGGQLDDFGLNGTPTALNVAGKNAETVIDNATVKTGDVKTATSVGGPDGNGTLILKNGAVYDATNQYDFYIGYKSYTVGNENPMYSTNNGLGIQMFYATTNNVGDSREVVDENGKVQPDYTNRYEGTYTPGAEGTDTLFGKGVVTVDGGSTLGGMSRDFCVGHGELNIRNNSVVTTAGPNAANTSPRPKMYLGYALGSTSVVNVESGSVLNIEGQLYTGCAGNSTTIINVDNATVNLNNKMGSFLGIDMWNIGSGTTEFNLLGGAKLNVSEEMYIGYEDKATLKVASTAVINDFDNKNTDGSALDRLIVMKDGSIENKGTINMLTDIRGGSVLVDVGGKMEDISMTGGELTLNDKSVINGFLNVENGFVNINGAVTIMDALTLGVDEIATGGAAESAMFAAMPADMVGEPAVTLNFAEGAYINMNGNDVSIFDLAFIEVVDSDGNFTLFTNVGNAEALNGVDFYYTDTNGDTQVGKIEVSNGTVYVGKDTTIPEPTTATLSLLALAALAARRRRRA